LAAGVEGKFSVIMPLTNPCEKASDEDLALPLHHIPRNGWKDAFSAQRGEKPEILLDPAVPNEFDGKNWKW
jgi:hypothetical protein